MEILSETQINLIDKQNKREIMEKAKVSKSTFYKIKKWRKFYY